MLDKSPNLIFVFADQMRARDMGCSGDPNIATPNLDRMATEGVRFTNATSMIPVCTPARAALLTGRYPLSTGMFLNDIQMSTEDDDDRACVGGRWLRYSLCRQMAVGREPALQLYAAGTAAAGL